VYVLNQVIATD